MITTRLAGNDALLTWLRGIPDAAASGLARVITELGIGLQQRIPYKTELEFDQSGDRIAATVCGGGEFAAANAADIRASLRRRTAAFRPPITRKAVKPRTYPRSSAPERSFMRATLEDMDPEMHDQVEAALLEILSR